MRYMILGGAVGYMLGSAGTGPDAWLLWAVVLVVATVAAVSDAVP